MQNDDIYLQGLTSGKVRVRARFARRDTEDGSAPDWGQPKEVTLTITRRDKDLKHGKRLYRAGELLSVSVDDFTWAEYLATHYNGNGDFEAEGWRMEILAFIDAPKIDLSSVELGNGYRLVFQRKADDPTMVRAVVKAPSGSLYAAGDLVNESQAFHSKLTALAKSKKRTYCASLGLGPDATEQEQNDALTKQLLNDIEQTLGGPIRFA